MAKDLMVLVDSKQISGGTRHLSLKLKATRGKRRKKERKNLSTSHELTRL
jgi:hypothetical protein